MTVVLNRRSERKTKIYTSKTERNTNRKVDFKTEKTITQKRETIRRRGRQRQKKDNEAERKCKRKKTRIDGCIKKKYRNWDIETRKNKKVERHENYEECVRCVGVYASHLSVQSQKGLSPSTKK